MHMTSFLFGLFLGGLQPAILPGPQVLQTPVPNRIEAIEIRGNRRIPGDTIKFNVQTKSGDTLNPDVIRRDIKTLYAQGYFDDIRVDQDFLESFLSYRAETTNQNAGVAALRSLARSWNRCSDEIEGWPKQRLIETAAGAFANEVQWHARTKQTPVPTPAAFHRSR